MVISVNREGSSLVLEHGPIAAVNWEAMTMGFKVEYASLLDEIKAGDRVRFDLRFLSPTQYAVSDIESLN
jgi:Cu/Ag efflux protein CusF